jgi:ketosteroid isomerase-like protein
MDLSQIRPLIEEGNAKFGEAFRQGDSGALAALYTGEAILLPPNLDMIQGKEGVEAFWSGAMKMGVKDAVLSTVNLVVMGDLVCEIGKYKLTIQPEGQEAFEDQGKYLVIWKQDVDGNWKLHIDIWNTSMPAQQ